MVQEPSEYEAVEESDTDAIMDSVSRTEDDSAPSLSVPEANSNAALPDKPEGEPALSEDICPSHNNSSRAGTPLMATDDDGLFADDRQFQDISSVTTEPTGRQDNRVYDTFPMPILADPTVPDPTDISQQSIIHGGFLMSTTPGNLPDPVVVAPDLADGTQISSTDQLGFFEMSSGQESLFSSSTSGLFTPLDEAVTVPETPGTLLIDANTTADITQLMHREAAHSTTPIPDASSVPLETMDSMETSNTEAIRADSLPAASIVADTASPGSVISPKVTTFSEAAEKEDDPFRLMGTDSKVAPGPVDSESNSGSSKAEEQSFDFVPDDDQ